MSKLDEIKEDLKIFNATTEDNVLYLLSLIESHEQDFSIIANSENVSSMNSIAEDALKAIRG